MITPEREAQILRYYQVDKWLPNTNAVQLGVHHTTVQRVLAQAGLPRPAVARHSATDPYVPLIVTTLQRFRAACATSCAIASSRMPDAFASQRAAQLDHDRLLHDPEIRGLGGGGDVVRSRWRVAGQ